MTPAEHVILGGGAALVLSPIIGPRDAALFWGASVLIDVDHHWDYIYRNGFRDWSLRRSLGYHAELLKNIRREDFLVLNLFHTAEALLLIWLAWRWAGGSAVLAVLIGMIFHLGLDLARLRTYGCLFKRALSVVEYVARRHRLVARGLNPDAPYEEALGAVNFASRPTVHVETLNPLNPHRTIPSGSPGQAVD